MNIIPLKCTTVLICTTALLFSFSFAQNTANHKYLGVKTCSMCHKGEKGGTLYEKWLNGPHAKAYQTLSSPESEKIAKSKGLKMAAKDSKECLECHATAYGIDPSQLSEKSKMDLADGVQCEECHGPAGDYLTIHAKEKEKAKQNGLILGTNDEKLCTKCHNKNSPTFKSFNYKEAWVKITHSLKK